MAERTDDWAGDDVSRLNSADREVPVGGIGGAAHAANGDDESADPAAIRADIRETRDRLGDTLEQIGDRLNPQHLKAQVRDNIREATIGRVEHMAQNAVDRVDGARRTLIDTIRENPVPAAMVGIGLGWLFMGSRRQEASGNGARGYTGGYVDTGRPYGGGRSGFVSGPHAPADYTGGYQANDEGIVDRVRERASDAGHAVRESAGAVADRAQDVASTVATQAREQAYHVEDAFQRNPLAVGAATLALGLAAGLALPVTDREVALMGDARDRLVDQAKEAASDVREKVQHVAGRVIDEAQTTAKDAAREEGLTTG